ncbi:EF-hand domain-containing protein, partial [Aduncisulcus paluster]
MSPPEEMMPSEGMGNAVSSSSASSAESSSITMDELQKAFANGDTSLAGIVGEDSQVNQNSSEEDG